MDADIAVIGGGSMGSMTLWQLARRGVSVMGFEQFGAGHDRGAAGGETRVFRTAYLEGAEYIPLLQEAYRQWRELEQESGRDLLNITGGLMIGNPDTDFMSNVLDGIEKFELEHEILEQEAAQTRYPQHSLLPEDLVIVEKQCGFLRPEYSVLTALQRAEALGATVRRHERVDNIEADDYGVTIDSNAGSYRVGKVIVTAGPWAGKLLPDFASYLDVRRIVLSWYVAENPNDFDKDRFPIFIRRSPENIEFWGIPTVDGYTVKLGLHGEDHGRVEDADHLDLTTSVESLSTINNAVREFLPGLVPDPMRVSTYMDAFTPDEHFIIGERPESPNTVVLCGFSGHGFKMASAMGKVAAELATEGRTQYPIEHLAPSRFTTARSSDATS